MPVSTAQQPAVNKLDRQLWMNGADDQIGSKLLSICRQNSSSMRIITHNLRSTVPGQHFSAHPFERVSQRRGNPFATPHNAERALVERFRYQSMGGERRAVFHPGIQWLCTHENFPQQRVANQTADNLVDSTLLIIKVRAQVGILVQRMKR